MEKKANVRHLKNFFINPRYQMRYILWATAAGFALTFYNTVILYTSLKYFHGVIAEILTPQMRILINEEMSGIVTRIIIGSVVTLVSVVIVGVMFSHRTVGPLYRFKMIFDRVRDGDVEARIHLRQKDDFREVAESFNSMMDKISGKSQPPA